jgi:hypothetical protein
MHGAVRTAPSRRPLDRSCFRTQRDASPHLIPVARFLNIRSTWRAELFLLGFVFLVATSIAAVSQVSGQGPQKPKSATRPTAAAQTCGPISEGVLKCPRFGLTYKTLSGWVDRTDDMQADAEAETQQSGAQASGDAGKSHADKPETLLAMFERPPGAAGDSINSAVVIVAESLADYHGIKTAADYFGPIMELNQQRGFTVENEPYTIPIGARKLIRGDFSKERGKVTMWQSSLVMIEKGYIVSFTFVGGSEDEVESLIGNLSFGTRAPMPQAPGK